MKSLCNYKKNVILSTAELINGDFLYRRLSNSKGVEPYCLKQNLSSGSSLPGDNFCKRISGFNKNLSTFFRTRHSYPTFEW